MKNIFIGITSVSLMLPLGCTEHSTTDPLASVFAVIIITVVDPEGTPVEGASVTMTYQSEWMRERGSPPISGQAREETPGVYRTSIRDPISSTFHVEIFVNPWRHSHLAPETREYEWEINTWWPDRETFDVRIELAPSEPGWAKSSIGTLPPDACRMS